jgi:hypothetical protein
MVNTYFEETVVGKFKVLAPVWTERNQGMTSTEQSETCTSRTKHITPTYKYNGTYIPAYFT